jgi:hypothetical protein
VGPVERAVRSRFTAPATLHTLGQNKPFILRTIDQDGIVLLLGKGQWHTRLTWECLETVVPFLHQHPGWVPAGGKFSVAGEPGTLDQHLKGCLKRDVARWLARLLSDAGVLEVAQRPELSIRLHPRFRD